MIIKKEKLIQVSGFVGFRKKAAVIFIIFFLIFAVCNIFNAYSGQNWHNKTTLADDNTIVEAQKTEKTELDGYGQDSTIGIGDLEPDGDGECKVIVAMNSATAGDYNLHMKVRDPSRDGGQVLFILEPGYNYTYYHPTTGESVNFTIDQRVIGTATAGDIPPNILKAGMVLTGAGLSFGDADNPTLEHVNDQTYAWDDFDWMRYAYQVAGTEDKAVELLTVSAVDDLHATSIGETLFVVGPKSGYAIEADAEHYHVHEIEDTYVRSNYPEFLWEQCSYFKTKYAPTFNTRFDDWVMQNQTIKLGTDCSCGISVLAVEDDHIIARLYPDDGNNVTIGLGENKSVYNFRVSLLEIEDDNARIQKTAHITICYKYLDWRERVSGLVDAQAGDISLEDMMAWSRLHASDLDFLRGFCEGNETRQEAVNIFRHPLEAPGLMSSLWYAGIPCSSVYVPIHICVADIYEPFKTGEAWEITLKLLQNYTHGVLQDVLAEIDTVFVFETDCMESICSGLLDTQVEDAEILVAELLTLSDTMVQCHGFKTEQILLKLAQIKNIEFEGVNIAEVRALANRIEGVWTSEYNTSLTNMRDVIYDLDWLISELEMKDSAGGQNNSAPLLDILNKLLELMETAVYYRLDQAEIITSDRNGNTSIDIYLNTTKEYYQSGQDNVVDEDYSSAADDFLFAFQIADSLVKNTPKPFKIDDKSNGTDGGDNGDDNGTGDDNGETNGNGTADDTGNNTNNNNTNPNTDNGTGNDNNSDTDNGTGNDTVDGNDDSDGDGVDNGTQDQTDNGTGNDIDNVTDDQDDNETVDGNMSVDSGVDKNKDARMSYFITAGVIIVMIMIIIVYNFIKKRKK